jgi:tripartite-type tricarboxylate transporter receptor subunit TctC
MIRPTRRDVLRYGAADAGSTLAAPAIADAWPSRPIRIVCGYPVGGLTDTSRAPMARASRK